MMNNSADYSTISPVPFGSKTHSREIDSLRAIAAFLVFLFHADGIVASMKKN